MLAVRAAEAAVYTVPLIPAWAAVRGRLAAWSPSLPALVLALYVGWRLCSIFADWWTTTFRYDDDGFQLTSGLLSSTSTSVRWEEVASVQASRPWLHQVFGCTTVRLGMGARSKQVLELVAVRNDVVRALQQRVDGARSPAGPQHRTTELAAPPEDGQVPAATTQDEVLYRIRPRDYLVISLTYGQFVLVVPAALGAYADVTGSTALPAGANVHALVDGGPLRLAAVAAMSVAVALAYGVAVAWLRYASYIVVERDGVLAITGGRLSQEDRTVLLAHASGLKVQQNPLMRVTGQARLSVVSREVGSKTRASVVFPAVSLTRLRRGIERHFPTHVGILSTPPQPLPGLRAALVAGFPAALLAVWLLASAAGLHRPYGVTGLAGVLLVVVANRAWAGGQAVAPSTFLYRHGLVWTRLYSLPLSAVHQATSTQGPLLRLLHVARLSLVVHDGRAARLVMVVRTTSTAGPPTLPAPVAPHPRARRPTTAAAVAGSRD